MKSLKDSINENRICAINEASTASLIRKLGKKATPVSSRDFGDGWLIGDWVHPYSEDERFAEMVDMCLKSFGRIVIAGREWAKPIDMDGAMRELEKNGEEPEGPIGFVLIDGEKYPELMAEVFFS